MITSSLRSTAAALSAAILLAACSGSPEKKAAAPGNATTSKTGGNNIVMFKVNGAVVQTSGWNLSRFKLKKTGEVHLNISSNMHEDTRTINANIGGTVPGTYEFKEGSPSTYGNYYPDYMGDLMNSYSFVSGSFIITELDTLKGIVNAGFSGTVKNIKGETLEIRDGKIENGLLKKGVTEY